VRKATADGLNPAAGFQAGSRRPLPDVSSQELPAALRAAIIGAPVLGWVSPLVLLTCAFWALLKRSGWGDLRQQMSGASRWLPAIALSWWLVLLAGDLLSTPPTAWWTDLRFLLVILPSCALVPMFLGAQITYPQIGRWAIWSVWVTVLLITAEYLIAVHWAGVVHHRPRALSGNALFVSAMLVPMILLAWLSLSQSAGRSWAGLWMTHAAGVMCLGLLLGARASTLIALALTPLPLLLLGPMAWKRRPFAILIPVAVLLMILILASAGISVWHAERWGALLGLVMGTEPSGGSDFGITSRAAHWPAAWQAVQESLWLGHGHLHETRVLQQHLPAGTVALPTAHQQYLSFMLWSGAPGLVAGCLLMALPLILARKRGKGWRGYYAAAALSLPMILNGLTDTIFDDLRIVSFHLMMTVLLHAAHEPKPDT
jgi:hypothetical protein